MWWFAPLLGALAGAAKGIIDKDTDEAVAGGAIGAAAGFFYNDLAQELMMTTLVSVGKGWEGGLPPGRRRTAGVRVAFSSPDVPIEAVEAVASEIHGFRRVAQLSPSPSSAQQSRFTVWVKPNDEAALLAMMERFGGVRWSKVDTDIPWSAVVRGEQHLYPATETKEGRLDRELTERVYSRHRTPEFEKELEELRRKGREMDARIKRGARGPTPAADRRAARRRAETAKVGG